MQQQTLGSILAFALLATVSGSLACRTDAPPERPAEPKPAAPWTTDFQARCVLIADEISIEGPPGLRDHVAYKQVPDQKYVQSTTVDGLLQEATAAEGGVEPLWLYVDNLTINAVRRARWLERVDEAPLRITARGNAYWKNLDTQEEKRAPSIELVGARPR